MEGELTVGQAAPEFTLPATGGSRVTLSAYHGKKVILYFYSKDNTAGCTDEAREFRDAYTDFLAAGAVILGISRDSISTHEKFSAKHELPFLLLSDTDGMVCRRYGVLQEKNMYGKKVMGVERSTFVINEAGKLACIFRKVKVAGHIQAVMSALQAKT